MKQERVSECVCVRLPVMLEKRVRRIAEEMDARPEEVVRLAIGRQLETGGEKFGGISKVRETGVLNQTGST